VTRKSGADHLPLLAKYGIFTAASVEKAFRRACWRRRAGT
jgi:hypothetical protein